MQWVDLSHVSEVRPIEVIPLPSGIAYPALLPNKYVVASEISAYQRQDSETHKGGHTLNMVISSESSPIIVGTHSVVDLCLSSNKVKSFDGYLAIHLIINMDKPDCIRR